jgi:hypothetical protein
VLEEEAIFLSEGRADLRIELREPVLVERALRDPVAVSGLIVAVDDAEGLPRRSGAPKGLRGPRCGSDRDSWAGWPRLTSSRPPPPDCSSPFGPLAGPSRWTPVVAREVVNKVGPVWPDLYAPGPCP